jgi:hypothetical protein
MSGGRRKLPLAFLESQAAMDEKNLEEGIGDDEI